LADLTVDEVVLLIVDHFKNQFWNHINIHMSNVLKQDKSLTVEPSCPSAHKLTVTMIVQLHWPLCNPASRVRL